MIRIEEMSTERELRFRLRVYLRTRELFGRYFNPEEEKDLARLQTLLDQLEADRKK